jgi:hypothetical protein
MWIALAGVVSGLAPHAARLTIVGSAIVGPEVMLAWFDTNPRPSALGRRARDPFLFFGREWLKAVAPCGRTTLAFALSSGHSTRLVRSMRTRAAVSSEVFSRCRTLSRQMHSRPDAAAPDSHRLATSNRRA